MGTPNTNPVVRFLMGIRFFLSEACDETGKKPFSLEKMVLGF